MLLYDEKHWRKRAEQMRALAAAMPDQQTIIKMNELADECEKLPVTALCAARTRQRWPLLSGAA